MKKELTKDDLNLLREANESVRGTKEYYKYHMCHEYKKNKDGRWTGWKYFTWGIPYSLDEAIIKKVKDRVFIMSKEPCALTHDLDRWEVTESVNDLLHIY